MISLAVIEGEHKRSLDPLSVSEASAVIRLVCCPVCCPLVKLSKLFGFRYGPVQQDRARTDADQLQLIFGLPGLVWIRRKVQLLQLAIDVFLQTSGLAQLSLAKYLLRCFTTNLVQHPA